MAKMTTAVAGLLELSEMNCCGTTRALKTLSQPVIRVVASMMPTVEVSHQLENGRDRFFMNFLYVLADEDGEFHPPKDVNRNEIGLDPRLEMRMRQKILQDVKVMASKGYLLSPGWWRQLGREEKAVEVERSVAIKTHCAVHHNAECIVEERVSSGRAGRWYRVRWEGYEPEWEMWRIDGYAPSRLHTHRATPPPRPTVHGVVAGRWEARWRRGSHAPRSYYPGG